MAPRRKRVLGSHQRSANCENGGKLVENSDASNQVQAAMKKEKNERVERLQHRAARANGDADGGPVARARQSPKNGGLNQPSRETRAQKMEQEHAPLGAGKRCTSSATKLVCEWVYSPYGRD